MRQHNSSAADEVKKFRYVAPAKRETLPQQWSREFGSQNVNPKKTAHGYNLDSAWSIKKNVSVNQNSQLSSKAKKDTFSLENSFYSRYGTTNSNRTIQNPSAQPKNHNEPKKFSLKPPYPNSVTSSSPFQNSDDEFDFDFPSSHSTKWTGSKPEATRSNPFTYSDSTLGGDGAQNNARRNYPGSSFNF